MHLDIQLTLGWNLVEATTTSITLHVYDTQTIAGILADTLERGKQTWLNLCLQFVSFLLQFLLLCARLVHNLVKLALLQIQVALLFLQHVLVALQLFLLLSDTVLSLIDFLVTKYLVPLTDIDENQKTLVTKVCTELQAINEILRKANAHVGYRVRDEIVFYMLNNDEYKLLEYENALDFEIMQKILPRIQGSTQSIKDLLIELFQKCAGNYSSFSQDLIWMQMKDYLNNEASIYPKSAEKICYMMRRFEEDGFTLSAKVKDFNEADKWIKENVMMGA